MTDIQTVKTGFIIPDQKSEPYPHTTNSRNQARLGSAESALNFSVTCIERSDYIKTFKIWNGWT